MVKPKVIAYLLLISAAAILFFLKIFSSTTVLITDNGFNPRQLQIKQGTTVVFKNAGSSQHWPASNEHPSHQLYPDPGGCVGSKLDACRPLAPGETYKFTFDHLGQWPLHDHLFPGFIMVVDVGKNKKDFQTTSSGSRPSLEDLRTKDYSQQAIVIEEYANTDPVTAWQYLKETFFVNGQVVGNAHEFAHLIGNRIYDKFKLPGIKYCDSTFAFGCYHGVSEKLLLNEGPGAVLATQKECLKLFPPQDYNYTGCIHGMGHGLLTWRKLDIRLALNDCDSLDSAYRPYCYDGVFMENALTAPDQAAQASDVWKLCNSLPSQYHYNCGRYQAQAIRVLYGSDLNKIAQACQQAGDQAMIKPCLESIGYWVAQLSQGKPSGILEECSRIKNQEAYVVCITASARETIFQQYLNWQDTADILCNTLTASALTQCLESNDRVKKQYNR